MVLLQDYRFRTMPVHVSTTCVTFMKNDLSYIATNYFVIRCVKTDKLYRLYPSMPLPNGFQIIDTPPIDKKYWALPRFEWSSCDG